MLNFFRRSMIARLAALAAVAMVTSGSQVQCSSDGTGSFRNDDLGSGNGPRFTTTLVLRDSTGTEKYSFQRGELITLEVTVHNRTNQAINLDYTGYAGDAYVFDAGGEQPIWTAHQGMVFAQVVSTLTFAANETKVYSFTWNQVLPDGGMPLRGDFQARGLIFAPGELGPDWRPLGTHELASNLRSFTIR